MVVWLSDPTLEGNEDVHIVSVDQEARLQRALEVIVPAHMLDERFGCFLVVVGAVQPVVVGHGLPGAIARGHDA